MIASFSDKPIVSIVTPSYNQVEFLKETILSVLNQDYPNIEYIIIDGGSTDGSVDIIKKYADRLAYWVSEPDCGQSHAINKGWRLATGDIIAYLNSDDLYTDGAVARAVEALQTHPAAGFVYSDAFFIAGSGAPLGRRKAGPFSPRPVLTTEVFMPQPTLFLRRAVLDRIGLLDESLHLVMDYDLWARLSLHWEGIYLADEPLAKMRQHAAAKTTSAFNDFPTERRRALDMFFARDDIPRHIQALRGTAYASVSFQDAIAACRSGRPRAIWAPLLRAVGESAVYVARRPFTAYLLARALMPWWTAAPPAWVWQVSEPAIEYWRRRQTKGEGAI